ATSERRRIDMATARAPTGAHRGQCPVASRPGEEGLPGAPGNEGDDGEGDKKKGGAGQRFRGSLSNNPDRPAPPGRRCDRARISRSTQAQASGAHWLASGSASEIKRLSGGSLPAVRTATAAVASHAAAKALAGDGRR